MPGLQSDAYALLESSFSTSPNLHSHRQFPRRRDDSRRILPAAVPLTEDTSYPDDETDSHSSSQDRTPLATPGLVSGADIGLPLTPPSNSQDAIQQTELSPPSHADSMVASLMSKRSTLSTPVNQRSPPTPDPSPPRNTASTTTLELPILYAYSSSRAESFTTAREDQYSTEGDSRSSTPLGLRLSVVEEDRGLGLVFERDEDDNTPRNTVLDIRPGNDANKNGTGDDRDAPEVEDIPNREWNTDLMRNVTVRRTRNSKPSPQKNLGPSPSASPATGSTARRSSSLRERVEANRNSPQTPSIENFAKSIGWPTERKDLPESKPGDIDAKRHSGSSMSSTVVEAMVIVTPPQRRRTLRHSGKNLALRRYADSPPEIGTATYSQRSSMHSDDVPLHRLVHKKASIGERKMRLSSDSGTLGDRSASPLSISRRRQDSTASTLAHQASVRDILQPAADIMSRSNTVIRHAPERSYHKRISSAPQPSIRKETPSPTPGTFFDLSPPDSPSPKKSRTGPSRLAHVELASPTSSRRVPVVSSPESPAVKSLARRLREPEISLNVNKSLPDLPLELPIQSTRDLEPQYEAVPEDQEHQGRRTSSTLFKRVQNLLDDRDVTSRANAEAQQLQHSPRPRALSIETTTTVRRGPVTERRRSSDRSSLSPETFLRPSLDGYPTEEIPRTSHEWRSFHADEHGRVSFDRSASRTEEHAMARHLYAQTTPFSQFSDTPIELSEATAVSIYPHNNHSLLVVQQVSRANSMPIEGRPGIEEEPSAVYDMHDLQAPPTPPFVDASDGHSEHPTKPTLNFEPATPPMQISLPVPGVVDSPLKNPRKPPEPPIIQFIPPTPAEELERQLERPPLPGPPKRSDSHPQRRLSLKQRARRYSDNFITPFLARANSIRGRHVSDSHAHRQNMRVPTVNDEDGTLHPFWRPRGFWDDFDDSDSESDDDLLPRGGDTSDVEDEEPEPASPRKLGVLGRRLTNGIKGSGGFLIGNSLGVERAGTNKRRPQIDVPTRRAATRPSPAAPAPHILIQPPTMPLWTRSPRIEKRPSHATLGSAASYERSSRRDAWRKGKKIPGFRGVQVQYIGLSGVKQRFRERKAERRREVLRKSIGGRWYIEPGTPGVSAV